MAYPVLQAPTNVQVVTRQVMDDHQDISVRDAVVGYVSSVQPPSTTPSSNNFYDGFNVRGFDNANIYRNDLRLFEITGIPTANLQSIEVLKGPAAMEFGRLEPGGIINLVPKRPLDTPYASLQEQFGSWGLSRTTLDTTAPVTPDKTWLYRVNLDYTNTGSFTDFVDTKSFFVAPTVTWRPTNQFRFNVDFEYQKSSFVDNSMGIPAIGSRPADIPISRYLQAPPLTVANPNRQERELIGYDWTYDFNKDWSLTNRLAYNNQDYRQFLNGVDSFDEGTGTLMRNVWDAQVNTRTFATNLDLKGKFDYRTVQPRRPARDGLFPSQQEHRGVLRRQSEHRPDQYLRAGLQRRPTRRCRPTASFRFANNGRAFTARTSFLSRRTACICCSADATIGQPTERASVRTRMTEAIAPVRSGERDRFLSGPRPGVQPAARRIGPAPPVDLALRQLHPLVRRHQCASGTGRAAVPARAGTQKMGRHQGRLSRQAAHRHAGVFDIVKTNVVSALGGTPFSTPVGQVESRGVEFDIAGRIDDNWSMIASYAYDDARIVRGQGPSAQDNFNRHAIPADHVIDESGNRLPDVPSTPGAVWVQYDADGRWRDSVSAPASSRSATVKATTRTISPCRPMRGSTP